MRSLALRLKAPSRIVKHRLTALEVDDHLRMSRVLWIVELQRHNHEGGSCPIDL